MLIKITVKNESWPLAYFVFLAIVLSASLGLAFVNAPWCDEVAYVDPGAQLALTGRMTSSAWISNSPEALWGSSNPGMPLLFAGWFKLVGFGQIQSRLLFCLLHLGGVALLFRWVRFRFNPAPQALLLGIAASLLLPSLANAIFLPRLESLALLLFAFFLNYAFAEGDGIFIRWISPALLGLASIFFGLHFAGFFSIAALTVYIFSATRRAFFQGLGLAIGLLGGLLILWIAYAQLGVWETFIEARACHYGRELEWAPSGWRRFGIPRDMPWLAALAALGLFSAMLRSSFKPDRAWLSWAWAAGVFFLLPTLIAQIGIYYGNYSWMVALPMMLCFYMGEQSLEKWRLKFFVSLVSLGLIFFAYRHCKVIPGSIREAGRRQEVAASLGSFLPKGSAVAADFPLYYDLVSAGYRVFPRVKADEGLCLGFKQDQFMPISVREQIRCVVSTEAAAGSVLAGIGGEWRIASEIPPVRRGLTQDSWQIYLRK